MGRVGIGLGQTLTDCGGWTRRAVRSEKRGVAFGVGWGGVGTERDQEDTLEVGAVAPFRSGWVDVGKRKALSGRMPPVSLC